MEVFEFDRSLINHLDELSKIFRFTDKYVPASQVRSEWADYIELIEQSEAWFAYWKIPRVTCEKHNIRYPTVVFGTVDHIRCKELKATFEVVHVQGDNIDMPVEHEVRLEDLWLKKDNYNLNIKKMARCIDLLRFFYKNIWMPWDNYNDDDVDWCKKHLESRIRFYYDLKNDINQPMRSYVKRLLKEARYLQQRKEILKKELNNLERDEHDKDKKQISTLMRIILRIATIKNKFELLENPETRIAFVNVDVNRLENDLSIDSSDKDNITKDCAFIVSNISNMDDQLSYLKSIRETIGKTISIKCCSSLQNCLDISRSSNEIYISPGVHLIKCFEYFNGKGLIYGVCSVEKTLYDRVDRELNTETDSIIRSYDEDSLLLIFDGDFVIKNVTLDCRNMRQGVLIRKGTVRLENCTIIGDKKLSTNQGIVVLGGSSLQLANTVIKEFSTAINCLANGSITFDNSLIYGCYVGIDCIEKCSIEFKSLKIMNSKRYGMFYASNTLPEQEKQIVVDNLESILEHPFNGNCIFESNADGNIAIFDKYCGHCVNQLKEKDFTNFSVMESIK